MCFSCDGRICPGFYKKVADILERRAKVSKKFEISKKGSIANL